MTGRPCADPTPEIDACLLELRAAGVRTRDAAKAVGWSYDRTKRAYRRLLQPERWAAYRQRDHINAKRRYQRRKAKRPPPSKVVVHHDWTDAEIAALRGWFAAPDAGTGAWLTHEQIAIRLGVSKSQVARCAKNLGLRRKPVRARKEAPAEVVPVVIEPTAPRDPVFVGLYRAWQWWAEQGGIGRPDIGPINDLRRKLGKAPFALLGGKFTSRNAA